MAARERHYDVSIVTKKNGWQIVYTRTVWANSKFMAAWKARSLFPAMDEEQARSASDITVGVT